MNSTEEVLRWCAEYIERDRKERFAVGDSRANAAAHLLTSIKEVRATPPLEAVGSSGMTADKAQEDKT